MKNFFKKLIYTLTLILVFGYGTFTIIEQQVKINEQIKEKENYIALSEAEDVIHEQLTEIYENKDSDSYMEEVARERGYIMPHETIFVLKGTDI